MYPSPELSVVHVHQPVSRLCAFTVLFPDLVYFFFPLCD